MHQYIKIKAYHHRILCSLVYTAYQEHCSLSCDDFLYPCRIVPVSLIYFHHLPHMSILPSDSCSRALTLSLNIISRASIKRCLLFSASTGKRTSMRLSRFLGIQSALARYTSFSPLAVNLYILWCSKYLPIMDITRMFSDSPLCQSAVRLCHGLSNLSVRQPVMLHTVFVLFLHQSMSLL